MKKYLFIFIVLLSYAYSLNAQAIRKSYLEMTLSEKTALANAFYSLRDLDGDGAGDANPDDDDLITDVANFHSDFFNFDNAADPTQLDIHFNLPDEPTRAIFFAWHRAAIFELEQEMQDINPNISMPYWDSTQVDNYNNADVIAFVNSTLFTPDFLGPFNSDWSLGRNVGANANSLPTTSSYNSPFSKTIFFEFANKIEREKLHTGGHVWVNGAMITSASPRDPVFFLHHAYVDKLWNIWEETNQSSSYLRDSMIRYDGTYTFHGETLPLIDPDDITDSKVYGTFYAENQLADLENYTVNNTYNSQENFYYQYKIQSGNNFTIPNTKNCKFESVNEILLSPGFTAESGSTFTAKIDIDNDITTLLKGGVESMKGVKNPFTSHDNIQLNAYEQRSNSDFEEISITNLFPNPFKDKINIILNKKVKNCKIEIYNLIGTTIFTKTFNNVKNIVIPNLNNLSNGVYFLRLTNDNSIIIRKFIKQ